MLLKSLVVSAVASLATAATVGERPIKFECGTQQPSKHHIEISKKLQAQEESLTSRAVVAAQKITVNTYVHVVARDKTVEGGYVSASTIKKQMDVLNQDYSSTGVSFVLKGTDYTINKGWNIDSDEMAMKQKLRKGTYKDLNLYLQSELDVEGITGVLGYCTFPTEADSGSEDFIKDGCSIITASLPGGQAPFDLGKTATHEVGHWFGLYHTFQGEKCSGSGDYVSDTPMQSTKTSGCPANKDSCKNQPGLDPIHNFMDYSDDSCLNEFTVGQANRIKSQWNQFRA